MEPAAWFIEYISKYEIHLIAIKKVLYSKFTKFQKVEIIDTYEFGKCLILDGRLQSAECDEFIYHEALVQPAFVVNKDATTVLIIGGGEGATLREVLKHKDVKEVTMVDIDNEAVNICKKYLKKWHQGAFNDNRVKLIYNDARKYLENTNKKFDIIIIDLTEPQEKGPSYLLYTREFYNIVKLHLNENGVMVTQTGTFTPQLDGCFIRSYVTLKKIFKYVIPYQVVVPSFGGSWSFNLASDYEIKFNGIEKRIKAIPLKYYNEKIHPSMFYIPNYMQKALRKAKEIISDKNPLWLIG